MVSLPPGSRLGRYQMVEPIGRGGMASVFRAHDPELNRSVAVKVMPSFQADDPTFVERFRQEAQAVASLNHPNIVQVYDFGDDKGFSYIVMERTTGGTLHERLGEPVPLAEVIELIAPIAAALDHAHEQGIVHRDVKPANVLIDTAGKPKLTDFGLARLMERSAGLTRPDSVLGTPEYMAPEQALGRPADQRSDLYALGVILYQMLLGQVPFRGETPSATLMSHIHSPVPLPSALDPDIHPGLEASLIRALAKEPSDRHESADALVQDVKLIASQIADQREEAERTIEQPAVTGPPSPPSASPRTPPPGVALEAISLDQARVLALRTASESPGDYGRGFRRVNMAFEVVADQTTEDHYSITLSFRPRGEFVGTPGQEQFFVDKRGTVAHRQVLGAPEQERGRRPSLLRMLGGLAVVAVVAAGVYAALGTDLLQTDDGTPAVQPAGGPVADPVSPAAGLPTGPAADGSVESSLAIRNLRAAEIWSVEVPGRAMPVTSPSGGTDGLFVALEGGVLQYLDPTVGDVRWRLDVGGRIGGATAGPSRVLYVAQGGVLLTVGEDGSILREIDLGMGDFLPAAGPRGEVYAVSVEGTVLRVSPEEERVLWELPFERQVTAAPVVGEDGTLYVVSVEPGSVSAINADGVVLWTADTGPVAVSPALGSFYVGTLGGNLLALDERDGSLRWQIDALGGRVLAPPVVGGDGSVWALSELGLARFSSEGDLRWATKEVEGASESLVLGPDDTAFGISPGGGVWAVSSAGEYVELGHQPGGRWLTRGLGDLLYVGGDEGVSALKIAPAGEQAEQAPADLPGQLWERVNPFTRDLLSDAVFIGPEVGLLAGDGAVYRTEDAGASWERVPVMTDGTSPVVSLSFVGEKGWALVEGDGRIVTTDDGGKSWRLLAKDVVDCCRGDVFFLGRNRGWAVGGGGTMVRTRDGGKTWRPIRSGTDSDIYNVYFLNGDRGWIAAEGHTAQTTDGGKTWSPVHSAEGYRNVFFLPSNPETGWSFVGSDIIRTKSAGETWMGNFEEPGAVPPLGARLTDMFFETPDIGWAVGDGEAKILRSGDGGATWDRIELNDSFPLWAVTFSPDGVGWAVGDEGAVFRFESERKLAPPPAPTRGGTLTVALPGDPFERTFNPYDGLTGAKVQLNSLVFSRLFRRTAGGEGGPFDTEIVGDLVQQWDASGDGSVWTLVLREGARFHDGAPVTVEDVQASIGATEIRLVDGGILSNLRDRIDRMEERDERTLQIFLHEPANIPEALAGGRAVIFPKRMLEQGVDSADQLIGSGPFRIAEYDGENRLVLERNHDYHESELPYVDVIELLWEPDRDRRLDGFLAGVLDFFGIMGADVMDPGQAEAVARETGASTFEALPRLTALWFDTRNEPFSDIRLRRAVSMAIDRPEWSQQVQGDIGTLQFPVPSLIFPQLAHPPEVVEEVTRFDLAKAKRLMAEAGFGSGLKTPLVVPNEAYVFGAELIASALAEIGIRTEIVQIEGLGNFRNLLRDEGGYKGIVIGPMSTGASLGVEFYLQFGFLHGRSANYSLVDDPRLEGMILKLGEVPEEAEEQRAALVHEIDRYIADQAYILPMPGVGQMRVHSQRVQGFSYQPTADLGAMLQQVWIDEGGGVVEESQASGPEPAASRFEPAPPGVPEPPTSRGVVAAAVSPDAETAPEQPVSQEPAPSPAKEPTDRRGFFVNIRSGEELPPIEDLLDPVVLAVIGLLLTLFSTMVQLVRGR